mmetsp:Transcript_53205/g.119621  ORF Transcript_53205/g.119621 Transcript_53205/m.119621 type:complete len:225 (+) Transcript_53205:372-1046(+)
MLQPEPTTRNMLPSLPNGVSGNVRRAIKTISVAFSASRTSGGHCPKKSSDCRATLSPGAMACRSMCSLLPPSAISSNSDSKACSASLVMSSQPMPGPPHAAPLSRVGRRPIRVLFSQRFSLMSSTSGVIPVTKPKRLFATPSPGSSLSMLKSSSSSSPPGSVVAVSSLLLRDDLCVAGVPSDSSALTLSSTLALARAAFTSANAFRKAGMRSVKRKLAAACDWN